MCEPITVTKPTPAQMAAAEADYLMRSFDGAQGVEPMFSEFYMRRLSQPTDIRND